MKPSNQKRTYRNLVEKGKLVSFQVTVKETDLLVHAAKDLSVLTRETILKYRGHLEGYIRQHPDFAATLEPWQISGPAPLIVREMAEAGMKAGVGPMAAVAGAMAEYVGNDLLAHTDEIVVENGGDIFIKKKDSITIGIFAGKSPLSLKIGLKFRPRKTPVSVCTSSGSIGHSLSFGRADAVCVVAGNCALADAAATSIGNQLKRKTDIDNAIGFGRKIDGIEGIVVIYDDRIGLWGDLEAVPLELKKG